MAETKTGSIAVQIEGLKKKRKQLTESLANHVDQESGAANASEHFAASIAQQVTAINGTITALEGLNEDGSPKESKQ